MILPILSWKSTSYVDDMEDSTNCIYDYFGDIQDVTESNRRICLGKFRAHYIDVDRATNKGISVFDVLDTHTHTHEFYEDLFGDNSPEFNDKVHQKLNYVISGSNLLILDRLEILPKYRGRGLGLKVLSHMITRFSQGAGVVAIKPFPLQFENAELADDNWKLRLKLEAYTNRSSLSIKKLADYYAKIGFLHLPNSPFMVLGTSFM